MELSKLIEKLQQSVKLENELWGIVVYERVGNGCLNGLWTNNDNSANFMNEIARKKEGEDKNNFSGNYTISYIEPNNIAYSGELKIVGNGIYNFDWNINVGSNTIFKGVGFKTGENQLTAIYWQL